MAGAVFFPFSGVFSFLFKGGLVCLVRVAIVLNRSEVFFVFKFLSLSFE